MGEILEREDVIELDDRGSFHFPDPDSIDKIVWDILVSPLKGRVTEELLNRLKGAFTYRDARKRLKRQDLYIVLEVTKDGFQKDKSGYFETVKLALHTNLSLDEQKIDNILSQIAFLMDRHFGESSEYDCRPQQKENEEVAAMLRRLDRLVLSECVVVGKYLRYDPKIRNILKDKVCQIEAPLRAKTNARENFLIWAAPGSGKTYLIQQIYEQLKLEKDLAYLECNLAKDAKEVFISKVNGLSNQTKPVLCLIDEIDARAGDEWPYEVCFPKLDLNMNPDKQVVIVLVGSTQSSLESMAEAMGRRHKGPDLLSRVLLNEKSFQIPRSTLEDGAAMVVGQLAALLGRRVRAVEKLALFYILCNKTLRGSPRQLTEFISVAATRFGEEDERLRFHHLFRPEDDDKRYAFRKANEGLLEGLNNVDVQVSQ